VAFSDDDNSGRFTQRTLVKFDVKEAFKGLHPGTHDVWVDPGSFTSCYAEYVPGRRYLVFGYGATRMPTDAAAMSVAGHSASVAKPLPPGIDPLKPPLVYFAPECSGTRSMTGEYYEERPGPFDLEYLRQYRAGTATTSIMGKIFEDETFGMYVAPVLPGVAVKLYGNGLRRLAHTDSDGYYRFFSLPAGKYSVEPVLAPYESKQGTTVVESPPTGCAAVNFDMIAQGRIEGRLLDHSGNAAAGINVEIRRLTKDGKYLDSAQKRAKTDIAGHYVFEKLPSGDFKIGVNLVAPPDTQTPYARTAWSDHGRELMRLTAGQQMQISEFTLPVRYRVRTAEVQVRWPDGRPASGVAIWGDIGDANAATGMTDANGIAHVALLQGLTYKMEAKVWVKGKLEVARSEVNQITPSSGPIHLNLVLSKRTKGYF
jgi:hypothetical protein